MRPERTSNEVKSALLNDMGNELKLMTSQGEEEELVDHHPLEQTAAPFCKLLHGLAMCFSAREHESMREARKQITSTRRHAEWHTALPHRGSELPREVVVKSARVNLWMQSHHKSTHNVYVHICAM